jgi:hypothetical protein
MIDLNKLTDQIIPVVSREVWEKFRAMHLHSKKISLPSTWLAHSATQKISQSLHWLCLRLRFSLQNDPSALKSLFFGDFQTSYNFSVNMTLQEFLVDPFPKSLLTDQVAKCLGPKILHLCMQLSDNPSLTQPSAWTRFDNRTSISPIKNLLGVYTHKVIYIGSNAKLNCYQGRKIQELAIARNNTAALSRIGFGNGILDNLDNLIELNERRMYNSACNYILNFISPLIVSACPAAIDESTTVARLLELDSDESVTLPHENLEK